MKGFVLLLGTVLAGVVVVGQGDEGEDQNIDEAGNLPAGGSEGGDGGEEPVTSAETPTEGSESTSTPSPTPVRPVPVPVQPPRPSPTGTPTPTATATATATPTPVVITTTSIINETSTVVETLTSSRLPPSSPTPTAPDGEEVSSASASTDQGSDNNVTPTIIIIMASLVGATIIVAIIVITIRRLPQARLRRRKRGQIMSEFLYGTPTQSVDLSSTTQEGQIQWDGKNPLASFQQSSASPSTLHSMARSRPQPPFAPSHHHQGPIYNP